MRYNGNMNTPTWYLAALADETIKALDTDTVTQIDQLQTLARVGPLNTASRERLAYLEYLHGLLEAEKVQRQTVRLAK